MGSFIDNKKAEFYRSNAYLLFLDPYPFTARILCLKDKIEISNFYLIENPINPHAKIYKKTWEVFNDNIVGKLTINNDYEGEVLLFSFSPSGKNSFLFKKEKESEKYSLIVNKYDDQPSYAEIPSSLHQIANDNIFGRISWSKDENECVFLGFTDELKNPYDDPLGNVYGSIYYLDLNQSVYKVKAIIAPTLSYPSIPLISDSLNNLPGTETIIFFEIIEMRKDCKHFLQTQITILNNYKGAMADFISVPEEQGLHLMPCLSPDKKKLLFFNSNNMTEFVLEICSINMKSENKFQRLEIQNQIIYSKFSLRMIYYSNSGFIDGNHYVWNSLSSNSKGETKKIIRMLNIEGMLIKDGRVIEDLEGKNFKILALGKNNILVTSHNPQFEYNLITFNQDQGFSSKIIPLDISNEEKMDPKLGQNENYIFWNNFYTNFSVTEIPINRLKVYFDNNKKENNDNHQYRFEDFRLYFYSVNNMKSPKKVQNNIGNSKQINTKNNKLINVPEEKYQNSPQNKISSPNNETSIINIQKKEIKNINQKSLLCIFEDELISNSNYSKLFFFFLNEGYNLLIIKDKNPLLPSSFDDDEFESDAAFNSKAISIKYIICNLNKLLQKEYSYEKILILDNFCLGGLILPFFLRRYKNNYTDSIKGIISCNNSSLMRFNTFLTLVRMINLNLLKEIYSKYLNEITSLDLPLIIIDKTFNYPYLQTLFQFPFLNFNSDKIGISSQFLDIIFFINKNISFFNFPAYFMIFQEWRNKWYHNEQIASLQQNNIFHLHEFPSPRRIQNSNYIIIYNQAREKIIYQVGKMKPPEKNEVQRKFDPKDSNSYLSHNENRTIYQTKKLCIKISSIPLERFHSLLLPLIFKYYPQRITRSEKTPLMVILEFIFKELQTPNFYIFFNSFGANVGRNHFHMQLISRNEILKYIFESENQLAIEKVEEMKKIPNDNLDSIKINVCFVNKYPIPHFKIMFNGGYVDELAEVLIKLSETLIKLYIPFHLIFTKVGSIIYLIPRKHQLQVEADIENIKGQKCELKKVIFHKLGKGAYELGGNGTISDEKAYNDMTANLYEEYLKIFAINEASLENIITEISQIRV